MLPVSMASLLRARENSAPAPRSISQGHIQDVYARMEAWAENDLLQNCEAVYCDMQPQPRSTIAIAFSLDGSLLASTQ